MSSAPQLALGLAATGQQMLHFDSCQLTWKRRFHFNNKQGSKADTACDPKTN